MLCNRCHERPVDVLERRGMSPEARAEVHRVLGFDLEEFFDEVASAMPAGVCAVCVDRDPGLKHARDEQLERALRRVHGRVRMVPFFLLRELTRRQALWGIDLVDRLVDRFRKFRH